MKIGIDPIESIAAFYAGQSIFLTGSTGFFGKIFIEKVLRSCKDVCEIFVLIRPKKGMNIDERLKKMLTLPLFDKLRNEQPSSFKKLIPILGDSSEKELGLSLSDKQMLIERVTIIVHAAASVRFNESLKYSILVNTRSTRDICVLAESMKNLTALVYVSTGYTQTDHPVIEEKVYPPKADWRKTIQIAESMDDHILNIFTAKSMNNAANTYVFSKNLAEGVIKDYSASLPCAIIRPTMVFPALSEPYSGWIDNVYGPIGLLVSGGKGLLRITFCQTNICQDWIPIDIVIKSLLQVIWKRGTIPYDQSMATSDSTPLVFNCASGHLQKISMSENLKLGTNLIRESPYDENLYECNSYVTNNFTLFYILTILWHVLPAMFIDLILKWFNFKFRFLKLHRNIYVAVCALKYFIINEWTFDNKNTMLLNETLPPVNVKEFQFQFNFNQRDLIKNALLGTKKYLFNDDVSTAGINIARARYRRLEILNMILKTCIILGMLWTFHHWKVLLYLVLSYILLPFRLCTVSFYNILA